MTGSIQIRKPANPVEWLAFGVATTGGAGLVPLGPGTWGTLVAAAVCTWWFPATLVVQIAIFLLLILGGIWATAASADCFDAHDPSQVVIDEVAGLYITWWISPPSTVAGIATVIIAFRVFDILKPPPVRQIDTHVPGAIGVMLDDVAAALIAGLAARGVMGLDYFPY